MRNGRLPPGLARRGPGMAAFTSLDELEDGIVLRADLAIVGAGAAGITLATALADTDLDVLLIESGNLELDGATQELCDGESVGMEYVPLVTARQRFFGGTTNHWTGWCAPLDPVDFTARPWLNTAGWPFARDALMPNYERAQEILELGEFVYDRRLWDEVGADLAAFDPARVGFVFKRRSGPTRMGQRYASTLQAARNIRVLLDANLVGMDLAGEQPAVTSLDLRSLDGRAAKVLPARTVLACGGIDNPRLLQAFARRPRGRALDPEDLVGRSFMEHPSWLVGHVVTPDPVGLLDLHFRRNVRGRACSIHWVLPEARQHAMQVANISMCLDPVFGHADAATGDKQQSRVAEMLGELNSQVRLGLRWLRRSTYLRRPVRGVRIRVELDQMPNELSRVTLAEEVDALGLPKPRLDWRIAEADERAMERMVMAVSAEITRLDLGRIELHPAFGHDGWARAGNLIGTGVAPEAPEMETSWHHMGTTRMAEDPRRGVVDANCRMHGVDNLYIAGSSVFPIGGATNPTMTIVAMALRLADHLAGLSGQAATTGAVRPLVDDITPR